MQLCVLLNNIITHLSIDKRWSLSEDRGRRTEAPEREERDGMGPRGCKARGSASEAKARGKRAKRGTPRAEQLCFDQVGFRAAKRRGKRRLGRPRSESSGVSHLRREGIAKRTPVHVTVKAVEGLP